MKERPILFSAPMVRAILEGRKTQTRRIAIKTSQPRNVYITDFDAEECKIEIENRQTGARYWKQCPYGVPGDRIWVRESFCDATTALQNRYLYRASGDFACRWTPSIHMPRLASRISLEITGVRIERLNDISAADAIAEGVQSTGDGAFHIEEDSFRASDAAESYARLWESINGDGSWVANPWVYVVEFKRVKQ